MVDYVDDHRLPGAVAGLVVDDRLAWWFATGAADLESGRPMATDALFRIASISKTLTATAVVRLRDQGSLRLDDPAVRFIPELRSARSPFGPIEEVTIRRLLRHTSGLATEPLMPDGEREYPWALEAIEGALAEPDRIRVVYAPGSGWRYSNLGYGLLGVLVARLSGRSHWDVVQDTILAPLGMAATTPRPEGPLAARCARGYDVESPDGRFDPACGYDSAWALGNGEYWSTVHDLAAWIAAQLGAHRDPSSEAGTAPAVLAPASLREMHRQTTVAGSSPSETIGLCWIGTHRPERMTIGHTGGLPGFVTAIAFSPRERIGVITLFNGWPRRRGERLLGPLLDLAKPLVEELRAASAPAPSPASLPVPPAVRDLPGTYRERDTGDAVQVRWTGSGVTLTHGEDDTGPAIQLDPGPDPLRFVLRDDDRDQGAVRFLRGPGDRVDFLTIDGLPFLRAEGGEAL